MNISATPLIFDGAFEARLIASACSDALEVSLVVYGPEQLRVHPLQSAF